VVRARRTRTDPAPGGGEKEQVSLSIDLPGDAKRFTLPNDWLQPGVTYTLDIKLIAENGNQTVRDVRFTTAD
jgi:hypothetical protein